MGYSTKLEIDFLRRLGMYSHSVKTSRGVLLRHYIAAARLRKDWGDIDQYEVLQYAELEASSSYSV